MSNIASDSESIEYRRQYAASQENPGFFQTCPCLWYSWQPVARLQSNQGYCTQLCVPDYRRPPPKITVGVKQTDDIIKMLFPLTYKAVLTLEIGHKFCRIFSGRIGVVLQ